MAALFFNRKKEHVIVCPACGRKIDKKETERNRYVCYECGAYFRVRAKNRVKMVADKDSFAPWFEELRTENPLNFPEYEEKLKAAQEKTGLHEALTIGSCTVYGEKAVLGGCDARFLMSSMASARSLRLPWSGRPRSGFRLFYSAVPEVRGCRRGSYP